MKTQKQLFILICCLAFSPAISLHAQQNVLTTGDFEQWQNNLPNGWNTLTALNQTLSSVAKTTDKQNGEFAAELKTTALSPLLAAALGKQMNVPGFMLSGKVDVTALLTAFSEIDTTQDITDSANVVVLMKLLNSFTDGVPCSGTPERFEGYYKYAPAGEDICLLLAVYYGKNAQNERTVAGFAFHFDEDGSNDYIPFTVPFQPINPAIVPNEVIVVASSSNLAEGKVGSILKVDNVKVLVGQSNGISEMQNSKTRVELYPNPSFNREIRILNNYDEPLDITITNIHGQQVFSATGYTSHTLSFPSGGTYFVKMAGRSFSETKKVFIAQ